MFSFNQVWKCKHKHDDQIYAIKEISKAKILDNNCEDIIINERNLLTKISHPFLVCMKFAFQDYDYLYIVMDFFPGGDMRFHLTSNDFSEEQASYGINRIFHCLRAARARLSTHKFRHSSRYKAGKHGFRFERLPSLNRLRHCENIRQRELLRNERNTWLYGARSDEVSKPYYCSGLLRDGCLRLGVYFKLLRKKNGLEGIFAIIL